MEGIGLITPLIVTVCPGLTSTYPSIGCCGLCSLLRTTKTRCSSLGPTQNAWSPGTRRTWTVSSCTGLLINVVGSGSLTIASGSVTGSPTASVSAPTGGLSSTPPTAGASSSTTAVSSPPTKAKMNQISRPKMMVINTHSHHGHPPPCARQGYASYLLLHSPNSSSIPLFSPPLQMSDGRLLNGTIRVSGSVGIVCHSLLPGQGRLQVMCHDPACAKD